MLPEGAITVVMFPGNFLPPRLTSDTRRNCVKMLEMWKWVLLHFPSSGRLQGGPNVTVGYTLFRVDLCKNCYNTDICVKTLPRVLQLLT